MFLRVSTLALISLSLLLAAPPDDAARRVVSGQALLQQRQWTAAAAEFQRAAKLAPSNADAHFGLALALRGAGDTSGAITAAQAALKARPAFDDAQLVLGLLFQQRGDVPSAIAQYKVVLKRNPKSADAHNWLGVAYMQKNQLADAITEFRAALKLNPDLVRAYNNLGSTLAQAGDLAEGITAFRNGLQRAPDDLPLRLNLGTALRTSGDIQAASAEFQSVLKRDPDNPEVHHQLGLTLRETGDLHGAATEFESAVRLDPEYRAGYYALGQTLQQLAALQRRKTIPRTATKADELLKQSAEALGRGDVSSAIDFARQAVAAEGNSGAAHNALGLALGRNGDLAGAIAELKQAVALKPDHAEAQFNLGAALWYSGNREKAVEALDEALKLHPAAGPTYSLRGLAYREAGDLAAAQRMFQRAMAVTPELPVCYFDLGVLFLRRSRIDHAVGQFEAGLNLPAPKGTPPDFGVAIQELRTALSDGDNAEAHNVLGRMLGYSGAAPGEVITSFEMALRIRPDFADAHNNLGLVYTQTGNDEKAVAAFRKATLLQPAHADAHANLGAVLTSIDPVESVKELEKAVELQPGLLKARYNLAVAYGASPKHGVDNEIAELRKLIAIQPNYPRAEFALGKALLRRGMVADAIVHLERAADAEPQFGEAQYQLGLALSRAGQSKEGTRRLQQGRELIAAAQRDQTVLLDVNEGKAALAAGELDQAVAKFRSALRQRPDLAEAHYQLGVALARRSETDAAGEALRKALQLNPAHSAAQESLSSLKTGSRAQDADDAVQIARFEDYVRQGKFTELQPLLDAYLKDRPKSSWGWYALGYCLFTQKKVGDSITALSKSLTLDITNAEAHKVLGRNMMLIGRFDAARKEFELGEKYAPQSAEMPFNLGRLFSIQDQWADARSAFERALKVDRSHMEAWDGLGFAQEALGDDAAALASYKKAADLNEEQKGEFVTPYVNLSAYYNRTGDVQAALEYARKAITINDKADRGWFQIARANERQGELDAAAEALNHAISINPRVSSYHYVLSTVYRRLGKQKESRDAMETFSKLDRESSELERMRREGLRSPAPAHE